MTKAAAIYQFWNRFLTAYEENTVPEDAKFPYITYQLVTDSFNNEVVSTASLWYRDSSWTAINEKTEEISRNIGASGKKIAVDGGGIWIKRGQPFAQNMGDESDNLIKRKYINISIVFITQD